MPLIAVFGATGAQGGSVVDQLSKDPRWVIRGITRDANSEKARLLVSKVFSDVEFASFSLFIIH